MATEKSAPRGGSVLLFCVVFATLSHSAVAMCSAAESAALVKFKSVFLDASGELATWGPAGANCCSWRGVRCGASGVEAIDIAVFGPTRSNLIVMDPNNAEAGTVAGDALAALPHLTSLRTDGVSWTGPLPLRQLSKVPLRELVIGNTSGGHLPMDIGTFGGSLERLVVTGSSFKTGLPSSVCKLTNLKVLEVSSTSMPNLGPSCLGKISSLEEVHMGNNKHVTGGLPVWLTTLPNLKYLDLAYNAHSGNIPVQFGKLGSVELHLAGNHLASRIPAGLSSKPESTFRPGNYKLCGAPLAECPV